MRDPLDQIRLRDLMLLEHVADLGTLRQAAEALHVTQPAVTQMLKGIEQAFGVPLVLRNRRGVSLTAAGQAALARLRCATPIASLSLLPRALARLRVQSPGARLTLTEGGVEALWQQLAEGVIDALVGRLPSFSRPTDAASGLRHMAIGAERMVLVTARGHPLARKAAPARTEQDCMQALQGSAWILPPAEALTVLAFNEWFAQAGLPPPQASVVSGSFYASLNMASRTDLVTLVPASAALAMQAALRLTVLDGPWPKPQVGIVFAARTSSWNSPALTQLRQCFTEPQPSQG
jgi:DNA-binding transcriptional LysR family regulator